MSQICSGIPLDRTHSLSLLDRFFRDTHVDTTPSVAMKVICRKSSLCNTSSTSKCHMAYYVFSASNPADLASRDVLVSNLENSMLWWKGPEWLLLSSDQWPIDKSSPPQNLPLIGRKISCFTSCHHAPYLGLSWAVFIMAKIITHHGEFNALYRTLAHDTTTTPGGGVAFSCDRAFS